MGLFGRNAYLITVAAILLRTNLRSRYRRTLFGYAWLAVPGLVSAIAFSLLRKGELLVIGPVQLPYPLFVLSGVFLWQAFVDALNLPTQQLIQQRRFLSLVPAPFEAVVLAALGEILLISAVRFAILLAAMAVFALPVHASWLLMPAAMLCMVAIGLVAGLFLAPFAQLYDDVASLTGLVATFGIFLGPVFYPVPDHSWFALNPLGWPIEAMRDWMAGSVADSGVVWLWLAALALLVPIWWLNRLSRPHIAARAY